MFIKEISDESYLAFAGKYSGDKEVISLYLDKMFEKITTVVHTVDSKLLGYVSVEGTFPDNHQYVLLYEAELDKYFVPIRLNLNNKTYALVTCIDQNGQYKITGHTFNIEDALNFENQTGYAIFVNGVSCFIRMKRIKDECKE